MEGTLLGLLAAGLIVGAAVAGVLTGHSAVGTGIGAVSALGVAAYLFFTNAGRVLLVAVALLAGRWPGGCRVSWPMPYSPNAARAGPWW
ncbi:hypothetical protein [Streptomyces sp. NPDC002845]